MSWCASGVGLQYLPFIDNRHLGNIPRFQRFPCLEHEPTHLISSLRIVVCVEYIGYNSGSIFNL